MQSYFIKKKNKAKQTNGGEPRWTQSINQNSFRFLRKNFTKEKETYLAEFRNRNFGGAEFKAGLFPFFRKGR